MQKGMTQFMSTHKFLRSFIKRTVYMYKLNALITAIIAKNTAKRYIKECDTFFFINSKRIISLMLFNRSNSHVFRKRITPLYYFLYFFGVNFCFAILLASRKEYSSEAISSSRSSSSILSIERPSNTAYPSVEFRLFIISSKSF